MPTLEPQPPLQCTGQSGKTVTIPVHFITKTRPLAVRMHGLFAASRGIAGKRCTLDPLEITAADGRTGLTIDLSGIAPGLYRGRLYARGMPSGGDWTIVEMLGVELTVT